MKSDKEMAELIAKYVFREGGKTYYVGGFVRDKILNIENKDIDIEIHGITREQLKKILYQIGNVQEHGTSFAVFGLTHHE